MKIFLILLLVTSITFAQSKEEREAILEAKKNGTYQEHLDNEKKKDSLLLASGDFMYSKEGLNPKYVVVEIDSLSKKRLQEKTINWIKEYYTNPDDVINTTISDEKVRFTGAISHYLSYTKGWMRGAKTSVRYTIVISFKNGRYKFEPFLLEEYVVPSKAWRTINFESGKKYYNENPNKKTNYKIPTEVSILFSSLHMSLKNYLTKNGSVDNEDW